MCAIVHIYSVNHIRNIRTYTLTLWLYEMRRQTKNKKIVICFLFAIKGQTQIVVKSNIRKKKNELIF